MEYLHRMKVTLAQPSPWTDFKTLYNQAHISGDEPDFGVSIPLPRGLYFQAECLRLRGNYEKACSRYNQFLGLLQSGEWPNSPFAREEAILMYSDSLRQLGRISECLELLSDWLIGRPEGRRRIQTHALIAVAKERSSELVANICLPIYLSLCGAGNHEIYIAYDNYLRSLGVEKPSEILWPTEVNSLRRLIVFIHKVCILEVMDSSIAFASSEAVEFERAQLLKILTKRDPANLNIYSEELIRLSRDATLRKGLRQIQESKVAVNLPGILEAESNRFKEAFARYVDFLHFTPRLDSIVQIELGERGFDEVLSIAEILASARVSKHALDGKAALFRDMFFNVRDAFLTNPQFGLNACLSVRIRHGILFRQVCAPFAEAHLLCRKDSLGSGFQKNQFWAKRFPGMDVSSERVLQPALVALSASLEAIAGELKDEIIQVKTERSFPKGLFDFSYSDVELDYLWLSKFKELHKLPGFLDVAMVELLERTQRCLDVVQTYITYGLRKSLFSVLDKFWESVNGVLEGEERNEVHSAVQQCQVYLQRDLLTMSKWFEGADTSLIDQSDLTLVVQTSAEMMIALYPDLRGNIQINVQSDRFIKGNYFTPCVYMLFVLLENAVKHCGLEVEDVKIVVTCDCTSEAISFSVQNSLSATRLSENPIGSIQRACKGPLAAEAYNKVSQEGGSGFPKLLNIVQNDLSVPLPEIHCTYTDPIGLNVRVSLDADSLFV